MQPGAVQIAAPLNDQQLLALVASRRPDLPPAEAVTWAIELLSEIIIRCGPEVDEIGATVKKKKPTFMEERQAAMQALQQQAQEEAERQGRKIVVATGVLPEKLLERNRQKH